MNSNKYTTKMLIWKEIGFDNSTAYHVPNFKHIFESGSKIIIEFVTKNSNWLPSFIWII